MNSKLKEKFRKLRLKSDESKSSFDRFSEDLTELIVSCLPFEDKFRFQCLSKRITKRMFGGQRVLRLSPATDSQTAKLVIKIWSKVNYPLFEKVLRQMTSLTHIRVDGDLEVDAEVVRLIAVHCTQLKSLSLNATAYDLTEEDVTRFGHKCGHNITALALNHGFPPQLAITLLRCTPELVRLSVTLVNNSSGQTDLIRELATLRRLRHLSLTSDHISDAAFETIGQYLPHLESLFIKSAKPITDKICEYVSQLKALQSLSVSNALVTNTGVKQLLDNCLHLRRLELSKKSFLYLSLDTIEAIISRAKQRPNSLFCFVFRIKNYQKFEKIFTDLPKNLRLEFSQPSDM